MARTILDAGRLRHKVEIWKWTETADDLGRKKVVLSLHAKAYAEIKPLRGNEYLNYYKDTNSLVHKVTMRYRADLVPSDVLKFRGRQFQINSIINVDEVNHYLEVMCTEIIGEKLAEAQPTGGDNNAIV